MRFKHTANFKQLICQKNKKTAGESVLRSIKQIHVLIKMSKIIAINNCLSFTVKARAAVSETQSQQRVFGLH